MNENLTGVLERKVMRMVTTYHIVIDFDVHSIWVLSMSVPDVVKMAALSLRCDLAIRRLVRKKSVQPFDVFRPFGIHHKDDLV